MHFAVAGPFVNSVLHALIGAVVLLAIVGVIRSM
ncbi:GlsB/YeaQ/YmgE family stress response membrane protein [Salmonella enterica]